MQKYFRFFFWFKWRHPKVILKLTDLYNIHSSQKYEFYSSSSIRFAFKTFVWCWLEILNYWSPFMRKFLHISSAIGRKLSSYFIEMLWFTVSFTHSISKCSFSKKLWLPPYFWYFSLNRWIDVFFLDDKQSLNFVLRCKHDMMNENSQNWRNSF